MSATERCESCGDGITDEQVTFGYDRSDEGQGRARFLALCDPCAMDYLHVLWSLPLDVPDNPRTARARELGGERRCPTRGEVSAPPTATIAARGGR